MSRHILIIAVLVSFAFSGVAIAQCPTNTTFTHTDRSDDPVQSLNDYGRIHAAADDQACAQPALWSMIDRTRALLQTPADYDRLGTGHRHDRVTGWNRGFQTALMFAAANRIGANGFASKDIDYKYSDPNQPVLRGVETEIKNRGFYVDEFCSPGTNTCMEDYASIASAYAWLAAYKHRRGDTDTFWTGSAWKSWTQEFRDRATSNITTALSPTVVCVHNPFTFNGTTLCNGAVADLENAYGNKGNAETLTINTGQVQSPTYGFGMMSSIASAVQGLQAAGSTYYFSSDQKKIARALFREMQRSVDASTHPDQFRSNCVQIGGGPGAWTKTGGFYCNGTTDPSGQYWPQMFRLDKFYNDYLGGVPDRYLGLYESNAVYAGHYDLSSSADAVHFTYGRYEVFVKQSYDWLSQPRAQMPFDQFNPDGYFDYVDSNGVAVGWTCDADIPTGANMVSFYDQYGNYVAEARTNVGSESAVNQRCGGGWAHRFSVQLPSWTRGLAITAYGLDYTFYGVYQLPCGEGTCTW